MSQVSKISLTSCQREKLENIRSSTHDANVQKRTIVVLMSRDGHSAKEIARITGLTESGIYYLRRRWQKFKFKGIETLPRSGRPARADSQYLETLRDSLNINPEDMGYVFGVWTLPKLNSHMERLTGVRFSDYHLSNIIKELGFSWKRPKHTLKNRRNKKEYQACKRLLARLKKTQEGRIQRVSSGSKMRRNSTSCHLSSGCGLL